jgi:hypothetical protein
MLISSVPSLINIRIKHADTQIITPVCIEQSISRSLSRAMLPSLGTKCTFWVALGPQGRSRWTQLASFPFVSFSASVCLPSYFPSSFLSFRNVFRPKKDEIGKICKTFHSENRKWYSSLPLGAVVALLCESVLWIFAVIILCVASKRVFIVVVIVYFVIDSVRKLLDTPPYYPNSKMS